MKKLITVAFSRTIEVDIPEGATIETLNDYNGEHADIGAAIVKNAADEIEWKSGEITDIQEVEEEDEELTPEEVERLKNLVKNQKG